MNQKLLDAEAAVEKFLSHRTKGATISYILQELRDKADEAELRAALWTLKAGGVLDFRDGKVRKVHQAKAA